LLEQEEDAKRLIEKGL